jgi:hypothetical protein
MSDVHVEARTSPSGPHLQALTFMAAPESARGSLSKIRFPHFPHFSHKHHKQTKKHHLNLTLVEVLGFLSSLLSTRVKSA